MIYLYRQIFVDYDCKTIEIFCPCRAHPWIVRFGRLSKGHPNHWLSKPGPPYRHSRQHQLRPQPHRSGVLPYHLYHLCRDRITTRQGFDLPAGRAPPQRLYDRNALLLESTVSSGPSWFDSQRTYEYDALFGNFGSHSLIDITSWDSVNRKVAG